MNKRRLGKSDLYVSELGLGAMSLGTDKAKATEIIEAALSLGVNYVDTADLYDYGENEEIIALPKEKEISWSLLLKQEIALRKAKKDWEWDPSKKHIKQALKDSLKRLQLDYIDLYQLHGGTIDDPIDETIEAFDELKQDGLIREYGISSIRPNVIKAFAERSNIVSVMMQYSILDRRPEEYFPFLKEQNISVVARGPVAKGILSDKPISATKADKEGYLSYSAKELKQIRDLFMQNYGGDHTNVELALHYCLAHQPVAAVVTGASSIDQLQQNIQAVEKGTLSDQEVENIARISKQETYEQHRF
ncbi:LOW QUALITY PROTEIN: oxidoreductase [Bacillus sp. JCM 19046]|nr:LOW QUALITY PROTEIN: oxidoreductase [Bacillus sp. JCM 19045]GAF19695.1 LOW QUALITY PROTEIN: oxidoreductase [Bacillus sp. JCM 19046]